MHIVLMYRSVISSKQIWCPDGQEMIRGQLHLHGSSTDIGHGSIYGNCQRCLVDRGVLERGNVRKVSDLRTHYGSLYG